MANQLSHPKSIPAGVREVLCASSLIPLSKKDGGVRPIAVGETLRGIVGKCLLLLDAVKEEVACLQPRQCGVGAVECGRDGRNGAATLGAGNAR